MSNWNTLIRLDPVIIEQTKNWSRDICPMIGLFADTKVGKTTWFGKLFSPTATPCPDGKTRMKAAKLFGPTLYIEVDGGEAAIGNSINDPSLVILRRFDKHPREIRKWVAERLAEAETIQCGAIVIEVVNAVYELELAAARKSNPTGTSFDIARVASPYVRDMFAGFRALKMARRADGVGVPIFVSLNVKGKQEGKGDDEKTVLSPNMSDNLRRRFTESADAMLELTRTIDRTMLIGHDTNTNPRHSIRGPSGSTCEKLATLIAEVNLDPAGMLALWADHTVRNMPKRPQLPTSPTEAAS